MKNVIKFAIPNLDQRDQSQESFPSRKGKIQLNIGVVGYQFARLHYLISLWQDAESMTSAKILHRLTALPVSSKRKPARQRRATNNPISAHPNPLRKLSRANSPWRRQLRQPARRLA